MRSLFYCYRTKHIEKITDATKFKSQWSTHPKIYELQVVDQTNRGKSGGLSQSSKKISEKNISSLKPTLNYKKNQSMDYNQSRGNEQPKGPIFINQQRFNNNVSEQLKRIEKQIRQCQRKIQFSKKQQLQMFEAKENPGQYDFEKVIEHQLGIQGGRHSTIPNHQNFDYLTNPGKQPDQEQPAIELVQQPKQQVSKPYNINEGLEKMERHYENSLRKKFQRREIFPHQACKRKTPKLFITQKNNALNKQGKPMNDEEHRFRVITKQTTPQQIYPTIPNFSVVKDSLSKNIVAYLGDYKPFLDKTKENAGKKSILKQPFQKNAQGQISNIPKENFVI